MTLRWLPTCCDLHTSRCEPPGDLCCRGCTEAAHPNHRDGTRCVLPTVLNSALAAAVTADTGGGAYLRGLEVGMLAERIRQRPVVIEATVQGPNVPVLTDLAARSGYWVTATSLGDLVSLELALA